MLLPPVVQVGRWALRFDVFGGLLLVTLERCCFGFLTRVLGRLMLQNFIGPGNESNRSVGKGAVRQPVATHNVARHVVDTGQRRWVKGEK